MKTTTATGNTKHSVSAYDVRVSFDGTDLVKVYAETAAARAFFADNFDDDAEGFVHKTQTQDFDEALEAAGLKAPAGWAWMN